ncbi:MAG: bifunctional phosphopantothenoylcysteine decarboxylase/phosphopantothenate--cysteine ligase CoaBC [Betaproteobacteria bacterium]|nr:bifunctional phosphopantothenoylcysteine decarboxylase/phosphopantothenate--cysteine ligase CoaBC [Betaproteobacteria bacterium]
MSISPATSTPKIVLGITGGIAAYKCAELVRLAKKSGLDVQVVLTEAGAMFITPVTLQAVSGNPVFQDAWDNRIANHMPHIELSRGASAIVIAPASADFLAKLANGLADDLLSTLCLARQPTCPLIVAPAMNREMWEKPATQRNVVQLKKDGVQIIGPDAGDQACGETGPGRMKESEEILAALLASIHPNGKQPLSSRGLRALVTAGPTFEAIDPVRGITNRSSGKMGYAIAETLLARGVNVILISGPVDLAALPGVDKIDVTSANDMFNAVKSNLAGVDLFFAVAAVADYTPAKPKIEKIKKSTHAMKIDLVPTVDILAWVAARPNAPYCVGFAAESHNVIEYAVKKREKKKIPMIIANHAISAIGANENEVTIIDGNGQTPVPRGSKVIVAGKIVDHALKSFENLKKSSKVAKKRAST